MAPPGTTYVKYISYCVGEVRGKGISSYESASGTPKFENWNPWVLCDSLEWIQQKWKTL